MMFVVVTELLRRDRFAKVKRERLEHVLLGVRKGRGLGRHDRVGKCGHDCCERLVGGTWLVETGWWYEGGSATRVSGGRTMHSFHSCVDAETISPPGRGVVCTRTGWVGFMAKQ